MKDMTPLVALALLVYGAPALAATADAGGPYEVDAQGIVQLSASGSNTTDCLSVTYSWDFDGDGTWDATGPSATTNFDAAGIDGPATRIVKLQLVCSKIISQTLEDTAEVQIRNVAPVVSGISVPSSIDEGANRDFGATFSDVEPADTHTVKWEWGDGSSDTGTSNAASHTYVDDGSYTLKVTVTDDDGGVGTSTKQVTVRNVAAVITGTPGTQVSSGSTFSFKPGVTDPGTADVHTWGGTFPSGATVDPGTGEVTWVTKPSDYGVHGFTLTVDDGTDVSKLVWTVEVEAADTDGDGMADLWEDEHGLDKNSAADADKDPDGDGRSNLVEYQGGTDPAVNDAPSAPKPFRPSDGADAITARPLLVVEDATTTAFDPLTYSFELYADSALTVFVASIADIPAGSETSPGRTGWTLDADLDENTWYWWRASASDPYITGPWSSKSSLFVNTVNDAPGAPAIRSPRDGASLATLEPTLSVDEAVDPEGDELTYSFTLTDGVTEIAAASGVAGDGSVASWKPSVTLVEGTVYCWAAWATDEFGLEGPQSSAACFEIDLSNPPPSNPSLLAPLDGAIVTTATPEIQVRNGEDPDGDPTWHLFQLDTSPTFDSADLQEALLDSDASGTTRWTPDPLVEDAFYHLRVLCTDGEADSDWVGLGFTVDAVTLLPPAPPLLEPGVGEVVGTSFSLVVGNVEDPEGGVVSYHFALYDAAGEIWWEAAGVPQGDGGSTRVDVEAVPDTYSWTARATNEDGGAGDWAAARLLVVAGEDTGDTGPLDTGDDDVSGSGCGCSSGGAGAGGALLLPFALLFARRRR